MAVPRPRPGADDHEGDAGRDDAFLVARSGEHVTIVAEQPDTEDLYAESVADRPGWHVRLFGSHEFFRLWLVQVVSATGDWLGFSAIILLAADIGGSQGGGAGAGAGA